MSQLKVGSINPNYHGPFPLFPRDRVLATITHGQDPTIWLLMEEGGDKVHAISSHLMEKLYGAANARERLHREAKNYVDKWNELDRDSEWK